MKALERFFEDCSKVLKIFWCENLERKISWNSISSVWPKTCVRDILKYKNHISIIIWSSSGTDFVPLVHFCIYRWIVPQKHYRMNRSLARRRNSKKNQSKLINDEKEPSVKMSQCHILSRLVSSERSPCYPCNGKRIWIDTLKWSKMVGQQLMN